MVSVINAKHLVEKFITSQLSGKPGIFLSVLRTFVILTTTIDRLKRMSGTINCLLSFYLIIDVRLATGS